jgi:hypothetical protein
MQTPVFNAGEAVTLNGKPGTIVRPSFFNKDFFEVYFGPKITDKTIAHKSDIRRCV